MLARIPRCSRESFNADDASARTPCLALPLALVVRCVGDRLEGLVAAGVGGPAEEDRRAQLGGERRRPAGRVAEAGDKGRQHDPVDRAAQHERRSAVGKLLIVPRLGCLDERRPR